MRSSSFSRIPKDVDGYGYSLNERVAAHRVNSMERIPTDMAGSRGYGSRALPYNRSFMDSLGFVERDSDMPMSRARSMMYLGEDDFEGSLPQRNSKADLALLAQSAINPNTDMMSGMGRSRKPPPPARRPPPRNRSRRTALRSHPRPSGVARAAPFLSAARARRRTPRSRRRAVRCRRRVGRGRRRTARSVMGSTVSRAATSRRACARVALRASFTTILRRVGAGVGDDV